MPGGRPTKYLPEYCQKVIEAGEQGKTLTWFAGRVALCGRQSIYEWQNRHPEFSDACTRARAAFQAYWEDRLGVAFSDRNQNSNGILTFLAATCEDFRPQAQRVELSGPGGAPLTKSLSREELLRLAAPLIAEVIDVESVTKTEEARQLPETSESSTGSPSE
jgi:hypothetical protein